MKHLPFSVTQLDEIAPTLSPVQSIVFDGAPSGSVIIIPPTPTDFSNTTDDDDTVIANVTSEMPMPSDETMEPTDNETVVVTDPVVEDNSTTPEETMMPVATSPPVVLPESNETQVPVVVDDNTTLSTEEPMVTEIPDATDSDNATIINATEAPVLMNETDAPSMNMTEMPEMENATEAPLTNESTTTEPIINEPGPAITTEPVEGGDLTDPTAAPTELADENVAGAERGIASDSSFLSSWFMSILCLV